jgi:hypothetical protein
MQEQEEAEDCMVVVVVAAVERETDLRAEQEAQERPD